MRFRRRAALAAWLLLAAPLAFAFGPLLQIETKHLSSDQRDATRRLIDGVANRLPPSWRDSLPEELTLEWRDDLPAQVHGRSVAQRVLLRRVLLDEWMARPTDAAGDMPAMRALMGVTQFALEKRARRLLANCPIPAHP